MQAGDIVLVHTPFRALRLGTYFGVAIRFGAWLRKDTRPYRHWNHAAIVLNEAGDLADAQARGVTRSNISDYDPANYVVVDAVTNREPISTLASELHDRDQIADFAERQVGVRYGFLSIAWFALAILMPALPIIVDARSRSWFCSELVAAALLRADIEVDGLPPQLVSPAHLARYFGMAV